MKVKLIGNVALAAALLVCAISIAFILFSCSSPTGGDDGKTVTVPTQSGPITSGTAGTAMYYVTTANIENSKTGAVTWYEDLAATISTTKPAWVNDPLINVVSNTAYFAFTTTATAPAGTYYFRVTIDGAKSNVGTLTIL